MSLEQSPTYFVNTVRNKINNFLAAGFENLQVFETFNVNGTEQPVFCGLTYRNSNGDKSFSTHVWIDGRSGIVGIFNKSPLVFLSGRAFYQNKSAAEYNYRHMLYGEEEQVRYLDMYMQRNIAEYYKDKVCTVNHELYTFNQRIECFCSWRTFFHEEYMRMHSKIQADHDRVTEEIRTRLLYLEKHI